VTFGQELNKSEGDTETLVQQTIGRALLERLGMKTMIQQFIRPRLGVSPSKKNNIFALLKEDFRRTAAGADASRQIAKGIMAIIGAVHFDGGIDGAKRVMAHLGLIIKLPNGPMAGASPKV